MFRKSLGEFLFLGAPSDISMDFFINQVSLMSEAKGP